MHQTSYASFRHQNHLLFGPQLSHAKYIVVPLCADDHWVVLFVHMRNKRIAIYHSSVADGNSDQYENNLKTTILWLKTFLAWLTGEQL